MIMRKIIATAVAGACIALLSSCSATFPHNVTAAPVGNKVGKSSRSIILGFIKTNRKNWGIAEAAKNGGIREGIGIVDVKKTNYLLFVKEEFIVYGN